MEGFEIYAVGDEFDAASGRAFQLQQARSGDDGQVGGGQQVALGGCHRVALGGCEVAEGCVVVGDVVDEQAVRDVIRGPAPVGRTVEPKNWGVGRGDWGLGAGKEIELAEGAAQVGGQQAVSRAVEEVAGVAAGQGSRDAV